MSDEKIVWVDLECSGLEEDLHARILEVGLAVTDKFGRELQGFSSLVYSYGWMDSIEAAHPVVKQMHTDNGLINELQHLERKFSPEQLMEEFGARAVAVRATEWLQDQMDLESGKHPMAGSTINYDRFFLRKCMPHLNAFFHYRNIDVSTIKNLCKLHNPELYARLEQPQHKAHRSLEDIGWSVKEYQFYLREFLIWG